MGRTSMKGLNQPSFLMTAFSEPVSISVSTIMSAGVVSYLGHSIMQVLQSMWLKKLFLGDKQQGTVVVGEQGMQEQEGKESKVFTVSQAEVDMRYSNIKIINTKSLHLPQQALHFIESVFFSEQLMVQGRAKYYEQWTALQHLVVTDRQMLMMPDIFALGAKRPSNASNVLHVFYGMIERMEVVSLKKQTLKLQFTLKDNRVFLLQCVVADKLMEIERLIREFGFPNAINKFYAFKYGKVPKKQDGWQIYNFQREMQRQGVTQRTYDSAQHSAPLPSHAYQLLDNKDFGLSCTYPKELIVPLGLTLGEVVACSRFRTKERLPILTYLYEYKPGRFASLFRCSQVKSGLFSARCEQDQKMIREIGRAAHSLTEGKAAPVHPACKVYDARGFYAALGNKLSGKGFEQAENYACQVQFLNIPNIHAVRDSYNKLRASSPQREYLQVLGESGWLDYLCLILSGARSMVRSMQQGINVVVHCSDGWDRTSQLAALTQLLLDPYYRTLEGFIVLVEKDWRSCGHKFRERSGQYHPTDYHQHEKSPVFLQFLDCVVQIINQFPLSFQFNTKLLVFLASAYQSATYGTFLTNNIKEATQLQIQARTVSVWSDILQRKEQYLNHFYSSKGPRVLEVSAQSKDVVVWRELLQEEVSSKEEQWSILRRQHEINANLKDNIKNYEHQIQKLKQRLAM